MPGLDFLAPQDEEGLVPSPHISQGSSWEELQVL